MELAVSQILNSRFSKDSIIALATAFKNNPYVRTVNAYYENDKFYVITHAKSQKMKHIQENNWVALSGEWFQGHGIAKNLGYIYAPENRALASRLELVFAAWFYNGHNNYSDIDTIILEIELTDCVIYSNNQRYVFDKSKRF